MNAANLTNRGTIEPGKVTKPIQLLAAWLLGMLAITSSFLTAAGLLAKPTWAAGFLVVAAVLNVPIFLFCIFLLQTKFRPEMQEDSYYALYLERRLSVETGQTEIVPVPQEQLPTEVVESKIANNAVGPLALDLTKAFVEVNDLLPFYALLLTELREIGVVPRGTFGSTSADPTPPTEFSLGVGLEFPIDRLQKILKVAFRHGLASIGISAERRNRFTAYLGSYGFKNVPDRYVQITDELKTKLMAPDLTWPVLRQLLPPAHVDS